MIPKGFVFLTLEDETGISNVIIRPDFFGRGDSRSDPAGLYHARRGPGAAPRQPALPLRRLRARVV